MTILFRKSSLMAGAGCGVAGIVVFFKVRQQEVEDLFEGRVNHVQSFHYGQGEGFARLAGHIRHHAWRIMQQGWPALDSDAHSFGRGQSEQVDGKFRCAARTAEPGAGG